MKKSLIAFAALFLRLIVGGAVWLHGNLDGLVQSAIANYGSVITGLFAGRCQHSGRAAAVL